MSDLATAVKSFAKYQLREMIYRYPPVGLQPERLHLWLDVLKRTLSVPGDIVEIGCSVGGTAAVASRMLNHLGSTKAYYCYDTFSGFVDSQFAADEKLGTPKASRLKFSANSKRLAEWVTSRHGAGDIRLIQGDVMQMSEDQFPARISACLIDVDLSDPVYAALRTIHLRLSPGGIVVVDDCPEGYDWKARVGYSKFMHEIGETEQYDSGMGIYRARLSVAAQSALRV